MSCPRSPSWNRLVQLITSTESLFQSSLGFSGTLWPCGNGLVPCTFACIWVCGKDATRCRWISTANTTPADAEWLMGCTLPVRVRPKPQKCSKDHGDHDGATTCESHSNQYWRHWKTDAESLLWRTFHFFKPRDDPEDRVPDCGQHSAGGRAADFDKSYETHSLAPPRSAANWKTLGVPFGGHCAVWAEHARLVAPWAWAYLLGSSWCIGWAWTAGCLFLF